MSGEVKVHTRGGQQVGMDLADRFEIIQVD